MLTPPPSSFRPFAVLARYGLCLSICAGSLTAHERENQAPSKHPAKSGSDALTIQTGWDTRYHSEGRDALDGDSLWRSSIEWDQGPLAWGLWYGNSPDQRYDELQLSTALRQSFGDFDAYLGYTHYRFPFDGAHDHEIGAGFTHGGGPLGLELALDAYHSFEAGGWFAEATASRDWELSSKLTVSLAAILGMNQGYIADGHDGANHMATSLGLAYALTETLSVTVHGTCSWAIGRKAAAPDDASLKDFFHAGIGLEWVF